MGALLGFLATGFNGLIVLVISTAISFMGGAYLGHNYEKNYYEAKIAKDKGVYQEELDKERQKGADAVANFLDKLRQEQKRSAAYQAQARALYDHFQSGGSSANCSVTFGFIRLFNASATGENTEPTSTDNLIAPVDLAAVLATSIENHGKYREAARQIEANKEAHD
jgi:hypothetical protein